MADPEATLAPYRAEVVALQQLVGERGLEAGLAVILSEPESLATIRDEILASMLEEMADRRGRQDQALPIFLAILSFLC